MKTTTLFLLLGLSFFQAKAQTETVASEPKKLQQLYVSYSPGTAYSTSDYTTFKGRHHKLLITATNRHDVVFRFGSSYTSFADDQPVSQQWHEDHPNRPSPLGHNLISPFLAVGKRKMLSKHLQAQVLAGLSFNHHRQPVNINRHVEDMGSFGTWESITYESESRRTAGFLMQAEVMALPLRFAGITMGAYYHYIPKISYGGLHLSLDLGRIRTKEIL